MDVVVVGAGPGGLALAVACAETGLRVAVVAPDPEAPWTNTYGLWLDELDGLDLGRPWRAVYDTVEVVALTRRTLARPYGLLDAAQLQASLLARADRAGVVLLAGRAVGAAPTSSGVDVVLGDRRWLSGRALVDASGAPPALLRTARRARPAFQAASGLTAVFDRPPLAGAVLMDWSVGPAREPDPSFLYGFDLGDGRFFVEETSLARRPALGVRELRRRLEHRLAALGVRALETSATESVLIPMGLAIADRTQPAIGFGAAASFVHPVSGYSLAASLRGAPRLAAALHDAIRVRRTEVRSLAALGWDAAWPPSHRRARMLHQVGLEVVLGLDLGETRSFFEAFFSLPQRRWHDYLSPEATARDVAAAMAALSRAAPPEVRRRLAMAPVAALRRFGG